MVTSSSSKFVKSRLSASRTYVGYKAIKSNGQYYLQVVQENGTMVTKPFSKVN